MNSSVGTKQEMFCKIKLKGTRQFLFFTKGSTLSFLNAESKIDWLFLLGTTQRVQKLVKFMNPSTVESLDEPKLYARGSMRKSKQFLNY